MAYKYSNIEYTEMVRMLARCNDNVSEACRQYAVMFPKLQTPSNETMQAATQRLRENGAFRNILAGGGGRPKRKIVKAKTQKS